MFCRTLMCGKSPYPWNTMLVGRFSGPSRVTSTPPISTEPLVGSTKPPMILSSVVLPQPDGPRIATKSP